MALCQDPSAVASTDVEELVAASILPHCLDGWSYLGRAADCLVRGDPATAVHLGYYAELRAAMSLLASQAIAVLNTQHVVLRTGAVDSLPKKSPTHEFAWDALDHWVHDRHAIGLIDRIVTPGGVAFSSWLAEVYTGLGAQPLAEQWFTQWGLDLRRLKQDRTDRNAASYRPSSLQYSVISAVDAAAMLRSLWEPFEPIVGPFDNLDRAILRRGLQQGYAAATTDNPQAGPADFEARVDRAVGILSPSDLSAEEWGRFLKGQTQSGDPPILVEAEKKDPPGTPGHPLQVLSRAALLLRMAVGACVEFMQRSGWRATDISTWVDAIGEGVGLWETGDRPVAMADLWTDVQDALDAMTTWQASLGTRAPSRNVWHRDRAHDLIILGSCERIALWGMGL